MLQILLCMEDESLLMHVLIVSTQRVHVCGKSYVPSETCSARL